MEKAVKGIVNSDLIGSTVNVELPGFPQNRGEPKPEPCPIHYLELGEGEPLLLVASAGQSIYTWRALMPILAARYHVIAFDPIGCGWSGRPASFNYSTREVADSILLFMDALNLYRTHLMGFSLGAMYALLAASTAPDRFCKIIALAPGGVTPAMPKRFRRMAVPFIGPFVREGYSRRHLAKALPTAYYDATVCTKEVVDEYFETCDDYASRQSLMYLLRNFDEEPVLTALRGLDRELLVLWGEEDRWQPVENMERLRPYLRRGVYYTLRNAGHLLHEERPEQLAEIVVKYIEFEGENV